MWRAEALGYIAYGTQREPVQALHACGLAVLQGGPEARGQITRDGLSWRTLRSVGVDRVAVVKLDGTEVEMTPSKAFV